MKMMMKYALLAAVLALPGTALATHLTGLTGTATCEGFELTATIGWGNALTADFTYTAVLTGEGGAVVAESSGGSEIPRTTPSVTESGLWGVELCGTYTATVSVHLVAVNLEGRVDTSDESFTATFTCDCPPPPGDACNYTPGYWKNHPENWPVLELSLGGVAYDQAQLLVFLEMPVQGDATIILAHHLIAAKLNVLNGSDPAINDAIDDADDLLASYPLGSRPSGDAKAMIIDVKNLLAGYNELGCGGADGGLDASKSFSDNETDSTWGQLKASYR